jgi:hypothetical protein
MAGALGDDENRVLGDPDWWAPHRLDAPRRERQDMNDILIDKTRQIHEPDSGCNDVHCYACNIDEIGPGYLTCGECFHVYRSRGELRRLYRRQLIRRQRRPHIVWRALTIRAADISFCPHCIHDF